MVMSALRPIYDRRQPSMGAYDAIVYIEGSEVVAEDSKGRKIASGTDLATIIQPRLTLGESIYISNGNYTTDSKITIAANARLVLESNAVITPTGNFDVVQIKPTGKLEGGKIDVSGVATWTSSAILLDGTDRFYMRQPTLIRDITLLGPTPATGQPFQGKGIYFSSTGASGVIYFVQTDHVRIKQFKYGIHQKRTGIATANQINSNVFVGVQMEYCTNYFYQEHDGDLGSDMDANQLIGMQIEGEDRSSTGITIAGRYNKILGGKIWDWNKPANANGLVFTAGSNRNKCDIFISSTYGTDSGTLNVIEDESDASFKLTEIKYASGATSYGGYNNVLIVSPNGGHYATLYNCLQNISDASITNPYLILIEGIVDDTIAITAKDYVDVKGLPGSILRTSQTYTFTGQTHAIWEDLDIRGTDNSSKSNLLYFYNCDGNTIMRRCKASLNSGSASTATTTVYMTQGARPTIDDCDFFADISVSAQNGKALLIANANPLIHNSRIYSGEGHANRNAIEANGQARGKILNCYVGPVEYEQTWTYASADNGRFRPFSADPYQLIHIVVNVTVAQSGKTLGFGTSASGTEIASGIDISATGYKSFTMTMPEVASAGYLYATPSGAIDEGCFKVYYTAIKNWATCHSLYLSNYPTTEINNCTLRSGGASYCIRVVDTTGDWQVTNSSLKNYNSAADAIRGDVAVVGNKIRKCDIVGTNTNITGIDNKSSGSSTGTGAEQTIAHSLSAIPTGCKAWIKYLVGSRYVTEMIPFDATNIYPTVDSGTAFEWRIE